MFPGMNSAQARQLMKKMGIQQTELDARQVVVRLSDKELIFDDPQILMINMQGQEMFQLSGEYTEQAISTKIQISEQDIMTVVEQTNCSKETAQKILEKHNGDIAAAILEITETA